MLHTAKEKDVWLNTCMPRCITLLNSIKYTEVVEDHTSFGFGLSIRFLLWKLFDLSKIFQFCQDRCMCVNRNKLIV